MKIKMTDFYTAEKIKAMKSVAKALIIYELETASDSWNTEELTVRDTDNIGFKVCEMFGALTCDFRYLFDEWCYKTMKKEFSKLEGNK